MRLGTSLSTSNFSNPLNLSYIRDKIFGIPEKNINNRNIQKYKKSLKENGYAEIDIPDQLKKELKEVEKIFETVKKREILAHHSSVDKRQKVDALHNYTSIKENSLTSEERELIEAMISKLADFTKDTVNKIFQEKNVDALFSEGDEPGIFSRIGRKTKNFFHKDYGQSLDDGLTSISVIYPFLNGKGTSFIPYKKKYKYPETSFNVKYPGALKETERSFFYKKSVISQRDVKNADPNKILIFLCRRASETLGSDYLNKSFIHSVPNDSDKERIVFLARMRLENKDSSQSQ